jgi:zinc-ribbon domain
MNDPPTGSERPLYLYIALLGNLIAVAGMAFLLLGILGALGLITAVTDSLGGFGSSFASATTGSAVEYSFAFLASLVSFAASWKMFREGPVLWLLALVVVFQLATAAVFHSWVSVLVLIPTVAALYGLVLTLLGRTTLPARAPVSAGPSQTPAMTPMQASPIAPAYASPEPTPARVEAAATAPVPPATPYSAAPTPVSPSPASPTPVVATPAIPPAATTPPPRSPGPVQETVALPVKDFAPPAVGRPSAAAAKTPSSRTCADCGAENPQSARFCGSCGSILPG